MSVDEVHDKAQHREQGEVRDGAVQLARRVGPAGRGVAHARGEMGDGGEQAGGGEQHEEAADGGDVVGRGVGVAVGVTDRVRDEERTGDDVEEGRA